MPGSLVGIELAGYKQTEQRRIFYENTIIPKLTQIASTASERLAALFVEGSTLYFDTSDISALREDANQQAARGAINLGTGSMSPNMIAEDAGREPSDEPGADKRYLRAGLIPLTPEEPEPLPEPAPAEEPEDEEELKRLAHGTERERAARWRARMQPIDQRIPAMTDVLIDVYDQLFAETIENLQPHLSRLQTRPSVTSVMFDKDSAEVLYAEVAFPPVQLAFEFAGAAEAARIPGGTWSVLDPNATKWLEDRKVVLRTLPPETFYDDLRGVLTQGLESGDSLQTVQDNLQEWYSGKPDYYAERVARTEIHGAFANAEFVAYQQNDIEKTEWLSSRDSRVRKSHAPITGIDGQIRKLGDSFLPNDTLRHPHDSAAKAKEIIGCRCVLEPVIEA